MDSARFVLNPHRNWQKKRFLIFFDFSMFFMLKISQNVRAGLAVSFRIIPPALWATGGLEASSFQQSLNPSIPQSPGEGFTPSLPHFGSSPFRIGFGCEPRILTHAKRLSLRQYFSENPVLNPVLDPVLDSVPSQILSHAGINDLVNIETCLGTNL